MDRSGSGTATWVPALNGGSTIHGSRSRLDACCVSLSGRSNCGCWSLSPANSGRSASRSKADVDPCIVDQTVIHSVGLNAATRRNKFSTFHSSHQGTR